MSVSDRVPGAFAAGPRVFAPEEVRELAVVGDRLFVRLRGEQTDGAYCLIEEITPPGGGPPPHVHRREDEGFYVVEGEFEFLVGDRRLRVGTGGSVWGPRGVPHGFTNVGDRPGRLLVVISPSGFERFFEQVDALGRESQSRESPTPEQLIELGRDYELEFLPPPSEG